jgi:hypothetical protein
MGQSTGPSEQQGITAMTKLAASSAHTVTSTEQPARRRKREPDWAGPRWRPPAHGGAPRPTVEHRLALPLGRRHGARARLGLAAPAALNLARLPLSACAYTRKKDDRGNLTGPPLTLWVPVIRVTSGDLRVLMDQSTEPISSHDPRRRRHDNWDGGSEWRCLLQGAVRAVAVSWSAYSASTDRSCRQPTISIRSSSSRRTVPTHRSAKALARGARTGVRSIGGRANAMAVPGWPLPASGWRPWPGHGRCRPPAGPGPPRKLSACRSPPSRPPSASAWPARTRLSRWWCVGCGSGRRMGGWPTSCPACAWRLPVIQHKWSGDVHSF